MTTQAGGIGISNIPGLVPNFDFNNTGVSGADKVNVVVPQPKEAAVKSVAPAPAPAPAPATITPANTESAGYSNTKTSSIPVPVAMVDLYVNGNTQQVAVNPSTTENSSTASGSTKGATEAEVKAFNAALADVDAKVGKTASNGTERAKNVAEARSKLSGNKLTQFDAAMKSAAEKTGANFGRNEFRTDVSKLSAGTQALLSAYTAEYNGTKKAPAATTAAATPTPEAKAATPTKKAEPALNLVSASDRLSNETSRALLTSFNTTGNAAAMEKRLMEAHTKEGEAAVPADFNSLGLPPGAQDELNRKVFGKEKSLAPNVVIEKLRVIQQRDSTARQQGL